MTGKRGYIKYKKQAFFKIPRLPLNGFIDITYRCNNNCLHCWLRPPANKFHIGKELTFSEIRRIVDEASKMGCRVWSISGGEPMVRNDFYEILEYISYKGNSYKLNTNGTLITPKIARLLKEKGCTILAIYGATAKIHDRVTRNPGSFEALIQGIAYLKEAGVDFVLQLVPMKANYHQWEKMMELAKTLTPYWRCGAPWLYMSAYRDKAKNREIRRQRLSPQIVVRLDKPYPAYKYAGLKRHICNFVQDESGDKILDACIETRRSFHIDPYAQMSFCSYIKDPALRYDLRQGTFQDCWNNFIPLLKNRIKGGKEYIENCGTCNLREECRWCPVYAYLEHGRYSAPIKYLCDIAKETIKFRKKWTEEHVRYFKIAGITILVESDLPIKETTFHPKFRLFETDSPGNDIIHIRHHFKLPKLADRKLGTLVYKKSPWAIYKNNNSWIYISIPSDGNERRHQRIAEFSLDHTEARIYHMDESLFLRGNLHSLTMFPTDQILISRILSDRNGFYLHASGVVFQGKGLLFVGKSGAGKSTIVRLLKGKAKILCDDRIIVRKYSNEFKIHGTWSNGEIRDLSSGSAPLRAVFFLKKHKKNQIITLHNRKSIMLALLTNIIKPLETRSWWEKTLSILEEISEKSYFYELYFNKTGEVIKLLEDL